MKILRYLLVTITFLSFSSCGMPFDLVKLLGIGIKGDWIRPDEAPSPTRINTQTDPIFFKYIDDYKMDFRLTNGLTDDSSVNFDIPTNFGETGGENFVGVCIEYPDGTKEILIDEVIWHSGVDEDFKEVLIYHELGHCHLSRPHKEEEIVIGPLRFKVSVMHPILLNLFQYRAFRSGYRSELFTLDSSELDALLEASFGELRESPVK